jgi:hypothetical protein
MFGDVVFNRRPPAKLGEKGFGTIDAFGNRGAVFEAFLAHLAVKEPGLSRPDIVLGDLGGPFTSGVGGGDQQALRTQTMVDRLNEQMGFRRAPAEAEPEPGGAPRAARTADLEPEGSHAGGKTKVVQEDTLVARTADDLDAEPKILGPAGDDDAAKTKPPAVHTDDEDYHALAGMYPSSDEPDPMQGWYDAMDEAANAVDTRPGPRTAEEAHERAPEHVKQQQRKAALARFMAEHPAEGTILATLHGHNPLFMMAALECTTEAGRLLSAERFERVLITTGVDAATARTLARQLLDVASVAGARYRASLRHVVELDMWSGHVAALPVGVRDMAVQSPLLLYLAANHPALLQSMHSDFLALPHLKPTDITPQKFEEYTARALTGHPAVQAETVGRRIVRFTAQSDFNAQAKSATPNTRYEFGKLAFTTDGQGRVAVAEGIPVRTKGPRASSALQTAIGNTGYATDVGFHLIAHIFGGGVNEVTVVPGNGGKIATDPDPNLNGSAYKVQFENKVRHILDTTSQIVQVEVRCVYNSGNTTSRPDVFQVRFKTDHDTWTVVNFVNKF